MITISLNFGELVRFDETPEFSAKILEIYCFTKHVCPTEWIVQTGVSPHSNSIRFMTQTCFRYFYQLISRSEKLTFSNQITLSRFFSKKSHKDSTCQKSCKKGAISCIFYQKISGNFYSYFPGTYRNYQYLFYSDAVQAFHFITLSHIRIPVSLS